MRSYVMRKPSLTGLIFALLTQQPACAQDASETLLPYAVNIHRTPVQSWTGYGIYLGGGVFITAAHVVGRSWMTWPKIVIAGVEFPTKVVKEGTFEGTDVTLLSVDPALLPMRLSMRKMSLCKTPPQPGQAVVTAVPERIAYSYIFDPKRLPASANRFRTAIADVARTGNSGSGVFDRRQRCLLGIMSRLITTPAIGLDKQPKMRNVAKYFVPAAEIAEFLPPDLRSRF